MNSILNGFIEKIKGKEDLKQVNFLPEESVNSEETFYKYTGRKYDLPTQNLDISEETDIIDPEIEQNTPTLFAPEVHYHCIRKVLSRDRITYKVRRTIKHYNVWITEDKFPEYPSIGDLLFYRPAISFEEFLIHYSPYDKIIWKKEDAFRFHVRVGIPIYSLEGMKIYIFTKEMYWEEIPIFIKSHNTYLNSTMKDIFIPKRM